MTKCGNFLCFLVQLRGRIGKYLVLSQQLGGVLKTHPLDVQMFYTVLPRVKSSLWFDVDN